MLGLTALLGTALTEPAVAQLDLSASGSASADTESGSNASGEAASDAPAADASASDATASDTSGTDQPAADGQTQGSEAKPSTQSEPSASFEGPGFGDAYTFNGPGRLIGIPSGSLSGTNQGYQMSWRKTGILFSGNTWIDTGYRKRKNDVV